MTKFDVKSNSQQDIVLRVARAYNRVLIEVMEGYVFKTTHWIRVSLINFCVVALAGVVLRYKISFSLPFVNHKYLLHGHSHFAFTGWVALVLMAFMVRYLQSRGINTGYKKYHWILVSNCITAYGMLITFILQGYALLSIIFSVLSIIVSYLFIGYLWKDLNKVREQSYAPVWLKTALAIWAFSSLGAFTLAYLMANHIMVQEYYFGAVYFFLHFQYNGWFLFACFGLLSGWLYQNGNAASMRPQRKLFWIMAITVAPTYFLSVLWLRLPKPLHWIADLSGALQLLVLFYLVQIFVAVRSNRRNDLHPTTGYLWTMVFIAFIVKIILQFLSLIPMLSKYAFGFRPIVIGYLHLSFLGVVSFFILGYINQFLKQAQLRLSTLGVILFTAGVLLQEIILMAQGLEVMEFEPLPHANTILLGAAIAMATGLLVITIGINRKKAGDFQVLSMNQDM